jgi:hypothetical protein
MSRRLPTKSREEKVADYLANITSDLRIDLDEVGRQLARMKPHLTYNRLMIIAESAEWELENQNIKHTHEPLF